MQLLDLLRKLGILRFGARTASYTNATQRPAELQMDGVFDAEKDLVSSADARAARHALRGEAPASPDSPAGGGGRRS